MRTGLQVGDAMTKRPICVPPNLTVREAAKLMSDKNIGSLLITDKELLLGIVCVEDIIAKVVAKGKEADQMTVESIMTRELITTRPDNDIMEAMTLLHDHEIRHLPVLQEGKLVGFITVKDIVKLEPQLFELMLDQMELREEDRKLGLRPPTMAQEGFCEVCGNFSDDLLRGRDMRLACGDCREDESL